MVFSPRCGYLYGVYIYIYVRIEYVLGTMCVYNKLIICYMRVVYRIEMAIIVVSVQLLHAVD